MGLGLFVPGVFSGGQSKGNEEETLTRLSWDELCCSRGCSPLLAVLPALAGRAEASPQAESCVTLLELLPGDRSSPLCFALNPIL